MRHVSHASERQLMPAMEPLMSNRLPDWFLDRLQPADPVVRTDPAQPITISGGDNPDSSVVTSAGSNAPPLTPVDPTLGSSQSQPMASHSPLQALQMTALQLREAVQRFDQNVLTPIASQPLARR
jgi:hypothetical protein